MLKPPLPRSPLPFHPPKYQEHRGATGPVLRAARWGSRPTAGVAVLFPRGGSIFDPEEREGLSEVTAEAFLGGTKRRDAQDLAEALDDLAAVFEVTSSFDVAVARLFLLEQDLEKGLELLAEILAEPSFPEDEIEKIRLRMLDSLESQRSDPDFLVHERLLKRLYPDHPYGRLAPSEEALLAMGQADVMAFHETFFRMEEASVVLVGAADPGHLLERARRVFSRFPAGPERPRASEHAVKHNAGFSIHAVHRPGSVQSSVVFAREALMRPDPRFPAAIVANQALGGGPSSRLFHTLREERGLTYGTYSSVVARRHAGHFTASLDCSTEKTAEAVHGLLDLVRVFAEEGPAEREVEHAKDFLAGSFALSRETPGGILQDEVSRLVLDLPEDEWQTWRDRIAATTATEAQEAAREFFLPDRGILCIAGDAGSIQEAVHTLGPVTVWDTAGKRLGNGGS